MEEGSSAKVYYNNSHGQKHAFLLFPHSRGHFRRERDVGWIKKERKEKRIHRTVGCSHLINSSEKQIQLDDWLSLLLYTIST